MGGTSSAAADSGARTGRFIVLWNHIGSPSSSLRTNDGPTERTTVARTDARDPDDNARTLGSILTDLGREVLSVVSAPRGLDVEVGMPMLFDQLEQSSVQPGDVVLGVGIAARPREAVGFIEEAGASGAAAVVLKLAHEAAPELVEASARTGVALLASPPAITWGQLYTLLRVAGGAAVAAGPLVDGVPMGDLFALANAVAAMVGGAVTIEDPQSYVLAYSSSDLPIDEARREVILGRRVPERFLRRLREAGVFHRLQTSDDVVTYVDQEEELIPRLAVGVRAGGELLGSIWVAAATDPLDADTRTALQEAARMAALHLIRDRSTWDLERRKRGELVRTLLDGEVPPDAAPLLGLDADTAITVVALRIEDVEDRHALSADLVARIERVAGLVALYFQSFHRRVAQVTIGRTIYVLVPESKPGERDRLLRLVGDLVERARATVQTGIVASVGSTVDSIAGTSWSRREADLAIRVLAARPDRPLAPIEAVRADTILLTLRDHALRDRYLHAGRVEALRQHDHRYGTAYVETLSAYFSAFGYVPLAAKRIFVHPNTFRYRLRRLTEISGLDLDDPVERLVAELQLRIGDGDGGPTDGTDGVAMGETGAATDGRGARRRSRSRRSGTPSRQSGAP
jgi:sugar diacid utilization regulator